MASTKGGWKMNGYSWTRLMNWIEPLVSKGDLYQPLPDIPQKQKQLALEIQNITPESVTQLAGMRFILRGLFYRDGVLSLCCYPQTGLEVDKLKRLVGKHITMVYCTLFQGHSLDTADVSFIENGISKWSEAVFGELCPYQWTIKGKEYWTPLKIAHRALVNGPDKRLENDITTIVCRCSNGLYSEIDIWYIKSKWYIGHDAPEEEITLQYLISPYLFIHAKNADAFHKLQILSDAHGLDLRIFYHTEEHYALTTRGETIIFPGLPEKDGWLYMMPERTQLTLKTSGMVCSDYA
jgi:hypothetical protein